MTRSFFAFFFAVAITFVPCKMTASTFSDFIPLKREVKILDSKVLNTLRIGSSIVQNKAIKVLDFEAKKGGIWNIIKRIFSFILDIL